MDWPGLMRAGMRGLSLHPRDFWSLTPGELALMLGIEPGQGAMTRDRLAEMAARFPDRPARGPASDETANVDEMKAGSPDGQERI
ncbi:phage tail assembly chaperone [Paracoccus pacificus]|uniref:Phage tail assembly chaperone n=1 Tax=Paracoccus pacificus TaxID=1463598 RepID=A0ABW4R9Q5_9RHOB